jgi:hypothetical protein
MNPFDTTDPLTAKMRFKSRLFINCAIVGGIFILVAVLFDSPLLDVITGVILYLFYKIFLATRTIGMVCRNCGKYVETNRPWICGNRDEQHRNDKTDYFPFIEKCEYCGNEPKSYQCHHCGELIFLTKDESSIGFARCADIRRPQESKKDPVAEKLFRQRQAKLDLEHEVEMASLKAKLKEEKSKTAEPPPKKTAYEELEEYFMNMMANEKAEREWRDIIDEQFKNDFFARAKAHRVVDQWMENRPNM